MPARPLGLLRMRRVRNAARSARQRQMYACNERIHRPWGSRGRPSCSLSGLPLHLSECRDRSRARCLRHLSAPAEGTTEAPGMRTSPLIPPSDKCHCWRNCWGRCLPAPMTRSGVRATLRAIQSPSFSKTELGAKENCPSPAGWGPPAIGILYLIQCSYICQMLMLAPYPTL